MSNQGFSELALQPLAPSDYSMVMAKSRENRLTFATWLMFFRDHGRFPRGPSDLESLDIAALARQIEVTVPADGGLLFASGASSSSSSPSSSHGNHATKWHLVTRLLGLPRDETRNVLKTCYWRVWIRICDLLGLGALNPDEA